MKLRCLKEFSLIAAALAVAAFFSTLCWQLWSRPNLLAHADGVLTRFEGVESKLYATSANLDAATQAWADAAKEQAASVEDLATDAHGTLSEANRVMQGLTQNSQSLDVAINSLGNAGAAATETLSEASIDLRTLNRSISATEPLILQLKADAADLDALLKDEAVHRTLANVAAMTGSGAGILADGRKVADKMTADYLTPVPWWKQPGRFYRLGMDALQLASPFR